MRKKSLLPTLGFLPLALLVLAPLGAQEPRLQRSSFAPGDKGETLLELAAPGRVSVQANSPLGVALQFRDRMEGDIARSGQAGAKDGRVDLSLDAGTYKVLLEGLDKAGGTARLSATAFRELGGPDPSRWPRLSGNELKSGSLRDLESLSFWIELRAEGPLEVEAMGRDLAAAEIWKDGRLLIASQAPREERSVETGRPQGWLALSRKLPAGLYLVRFHGGPARAWASEAGEHPFHARAGFALAPVGGRMDLVISPFGRDFVLSEGAEAVRASRKDKGDTLLAATPYLPGADRLASRTRGSIDRKSLSPTVEIDLPDGPALVRVEGKPGEALSLDFHVPASRGGVEAERSRAGGLLTVLTPRSGADTMPPTGLVLRPVPRSDRRELVRDFAAPLSASSPLRWRTNLLQGGGGTGILLRVDEAASYRILEKSGQGQAAAIYRMTPLDPSFAFGRPGNDAPADKALFILGRGYHWLEVEARSLGVLDFVLYKEGLAGSPRELLAREPAALPSSRSFYVPAGQGGEGLEILAGGNGDVETGYLFQPFPLGLDRGLSLELGAGEELHLPTRLGRPGRLLVPGKGASLVLGGQTLVDGAALLPGERELVLRNPGTTALVLRAGFVPTDDDLPAPALGVFGKGATAVNPGATSWRDFRKDEKALYAFTVREAGIWVVETEGRLSTALTLRSSSRMELFQARENGYGRNAALRVFLRPGEYWVEATATGRSAGRAGLRVDRVPLAARSPLEAGVVDRRAVPADESLRYVFSLSAPSLVELSSIGLGSAFPVRLEDAEGFPAYRGEGRTRQRLGAGDWTLLALPLSLETRRLTWYRLLPEGESPARAADGSPLLSWNETRSAILADRPEGDRWAFTVPSGLTAGIELPAGLEASLSGPGGERPLPPEARKNLALAPGDYRLRVWPKDRAAQLSYSIGLSTRVLAPGITVQAKPGAAAETIEVSVPLDGYYELWSLGQNDIRAELRPAPPAGSAAPSGAAALPAPGLPLAQADDRGADWNFSIVQKLKAGRYLLQLRSLAGGGKPVELHLDSRAPRALGRFPTPWETSLELDPSGVILDLDSGGEEGLFLAGADSPIPASFRLYRGDRLLGAGEGSLAIPLRKGTGYSLHVWSPAPARAKLSVARLPERPLGLDKAARLEAGTAWRIQNPELRSALLAEGRLLVSPGLEQACAAPGSEPFSTLAEGGWAYSPGPGASILPFAPATGEAALLPLDRADQGFPLQSEGQAILVQADSRGAFRAGLAVRPQTLAGPVPYDWRGQAPWSQGSLALLPPGRWKLRAWDGEKAEGTRRRLALVTRGLPLASLPAPSPASRDSLTVPAGSAVSLELPASTLQVLLGEGLVMAAWKEGEALAARSSFDGRLADSLSLPACTLLLANPGPRDAAVRLALLPPRAVAVEELSASKPWEGVDLPPEGLRLAVKAQAGELLCLAGEDVGAEFEADDGRFIALRAPAAGGWVSIPASSGRLLLRSGGGLARAWVARPGRELEGLLADPGGASGRELGETAPLSGSGDAFRLRLASPGFVDLSFAGPGLVALSGQGMEPRWAWSGAREDIHLFAWLPSGEYRVWQRPARGTASGGVLRADRVESRALAVAAGSTLPPAFIGAGEYQAWSFPVTAAGLVGVGVRAARDGLEAFLYDSGQGLLGRGTLIFRKLEPGTYLLVVKGLERSPLEYRITLEGADGSRRGIPPGVEAGYGAGPGTTASRGVPMRAPGLKPWGTFPLPAPGGDFGAEVLDDEYVDEDGGGEGDYDGGEAPDGE